MTWRDAVKTVMLRYSNLALERIHACLHKGGPEFQAVSASRECWHYGLLFRDGKIERSGIPDYTTEIEYRVPFTKSTLPAKEKK